MTIASMSDVLWEEKPKAALTLALLNCCKDRDYKVIRGDTSANDVCTFYAVALHPHETYDFVLMAKPSGCLAIFVDLFSYDGKWKNEEGETTFPNVVRGSTTLVDLIEQVWAFLQQ